MITFLMDRLDIRFMIDCKDGVIDSENIGNIFSSLKDYFPDTENSSDMCIFSNKKDGFLFALGPQIIQFISAKSKDADKVKELLNNCFSAFEKYASKNIKEIQCLSCSISYLGIVDDTEYDPCCYLDKIHSDVFPGLELLKLRLLGFEFTDDQVNYRITITPLEESDEDNDDNHDRNKAVFECALGCAILNDVALNSYNECINKADSHMNVLGKQLIESVLINKPVEG